jgi:hypothetical protein
LQKKSGAGETPDFAVFAGVFEGGLAKSGGLLLVVLW